MRARDRNGGDSLDIGTDKSKSPESLRGFLKLIGRRPTLPHTRAYSTIGAERLNFRVRDGNGWDPLAMVTQNRGGRDYSTSLLNIDGLAT